MSRKYEVQKAKTAKTFELKEIHADSYLARVRDEDVAHRIATLMEMDEPTRQLVSLPEDTYNKLGDLLEFYTESGSPSWINHTDIINASVKAVHHEIFGRQLVKI